MQSGWAHANGGKNGGDIIKILLPHAMVEQPAAEVNYGVSGLLHPVVHPIQEYHLLYDAETTWPGASLLVPYLQANLY
jgi:hypothetical protein